MLPRLRSNVLLSILFVTFLFPQILATYRTVNVGLHASWPHTPAASEATAWLAQTMGNRAVVPFLRSLSSLVQHHHAVSRIPISHRLEHQFVLKALEKQPCNPLVKATLDWVLQARQFSPHVQLHHSFAKETLSAFENAADTGRNIFAVEFNFERTEAKLIRNPTELGKCKQCQIMKTEGGDALPFLVGLPREIEISGGCPGAGRTIFVYANVATEEFGEWLKEIEEGRLECEKRILLRFWDRGRISVGEDGPGMQGFVVKAALKSTEYKVIDDRAFGTNLFEDCGYGRRECEQGKKEWEEGVEYEWQDGEELGYTGGKVMEFLRESAEGDLGKALESLKVFAEDAPSVTRAKKFAEFQGLDDSAVKGLAKNVRKFRERVGDADFLFINGHAFDLHTATEKMEQLFRCVSFSTVASMNREVLRAELGEGKERELGRNGGDVKNRLRVDLDLGNSLKSSLVWFNDLYKDSRYKKWQPLDEKSEKDIVDFRSLMENLEKKVTGPSSEHLQLAKIKAHHMSLVVALDAGDPQQFPYTGIPQTIVRSDLPIHIGLVLVPNGRVSSLIAASFHYFLRIKGRKTSAEFLQMIQQVLQYVGGGFQQVPLSEQIVELAFQQIAGKIEGQYSSAAGVLDGDEEIKAILQEVRSFAEEKELLSQRDEDDVVDGENPMQFSLLGILNGIVLKDISSDIITVAILEQERVARFLESGVREKEKDAQTDFERWVERDETLIIVKGLSQEMKRGDQRLSRIKSDDEKRRIPGTTLFSLRDQMKSVQYINVTNDNDKSVEHSVTVWVAGNNEESETLIRATSLVKELASSDFASRTKVRFTVLEPGSALHSSVLENALGEHDSSDGYFVLNGRIISASGVKTLDELKVEVATEYERSSLSGGSGDAGLIYATLVQDTKSACESEAQSRSARDVQVSLLEIRKAVLETNVSTYAFSSIAGHAPLLEIYAVLNPLGKTAFISSAVLSALNEAYDFDDVEMEVVLVTASNEIKGHVNPPSEFSKFLISSQASFEGSSDGRIPPTAVFSRLPQKGILTVSVEPPRAWFVSSYATNYDMDNVILTSLPEKVDRLYAQYQLKNLIVEGSCIDENESPPQGLKLILENDAGVTIDTLVMANLGYFQLKVPAPGRWLLRLAPGSSSKIFSLRVMEMYAGLVKTVYKADRTGRVPILVQSLSGAGGILLRVQRNPGMEGKSVLNPNNTNEESTRGRGIAGRLRAKLSSIYKSKAQQPGGELGSSSGRKQEKVHVFSVASGHLYERFLKIMMSSVSKHSSRPVKFWLLENYLSPSFKKMLPVFAKRLGCEVGMVTYKWPGWLRAQTEKQRIIWAYKILFLDVLFPLDVERIIFVDSDQVIRGDVAELMDIDLQGAPYGYVPFCDSRKEVEGYRFWKQGFWKELLRDEKYRISALYVVDLIRFRETAAGDTLRLVYQSLSGDPNSLSNLDQDLPNYASVSSMGGGNVVPIFDLPADWLWCESWCDDESKKSAKAIDLCNNPMTKEPKLQSAKRIIAEWVDYDDSASRLTEEIYKEVVNNDSDTVQEVTRDHETCQSGQKCESSTDDGDYEKTEL